MEKVEFFDWKLNTHRPLSWAFSQSASVKNSNPPDVHSAVHLLIVLQGSISAEYADGILDFNAGEIFITAPWEIHRTVLRCDNKLLFVNIDPAALQKFFFCGYENVERLFMLPPTERRQCLNIDHDLHAESLKIVQISDLPDSPQKPLYMWHAILSLFMHLHIEEAPNLEQGEARRRLRPALQMLSGRVLTAQAAAASCKLSSSYFTALFKKSYGMSFARYERMFRLNSAAEAIAGGASLKEAADDWGFCDKSHLARLLKKYNTMNSPQQ